MNKLLKHKADFNHKLAIKIYMCSFTLILVKFVPQLMENVHWGVYAGILGLSYLYCLKRVINS